MEISEQVKAIEKEIKRLEMARKVAIEKVQNFVDCWETPGGLPENKAAAIKPLKDLLAFLY